METTIKTQIERVAEAVVETAKSATTEDKVRCRKQMKMPSSTFWNYITGKGADPDKTLKIIALLKQYIAKREEAIQKTLA